MKMTSLMTLVVCLAAVIGTVPVFAAPALKVNLPYAVSFGNVTLPAGECTVTDTKDNGHETFFVIRSTQGPAVDVMLERDGNLDKKGDSSAIQLRQVGDKYELSGLRIDGVTYKVSQ